MSSRQLDLDEQLGLELSFGDGFLEHHAGNIIADPHYALIELVANCWDAGASRVDISWPEKDNGFLSVQDDGTGMTYGEFTQRWTKLKYNRLRHQGSTVEFPPKVKKRERIAFGQNGIGRHAMFCFANRYYVETKKNGDFHLIKVERSSLDTPFNLTLEDKGNAEGHGTKLYTDATSNNIDLTSEQVSELIGSRFVSDPEFNIYVNKKPVSLEDIDHLCDTHLINVSGHGELKVHRFDAKKAGRTSKQSGIAWWVNRRLVGVPSWEGSNGPLLDSRSSTAKRITYVVEADQLLGEIKPDWSGFYSSQITQAIRRSAFNFIKDDLRSLMRDVRKDRKRDALKANKNNIKRLPLLSQQQIYSFLEEVQVLCPTMQQRDLNNAVRVLANLEESRSGYALIEKLSLLKGSELEQLDIILHEWTVSDAKKVLDELHYRLKLIKQLDTIVESQTADELHDLQPLFESGLWIFGPEFESISSTSNRSLSTVVRKFFGDAVLENPSQRPDFVVLPDRSIGTYSCDKFDENHEVSGFRSVFIVELKKGGFKVTHKEKSQALEYARALRKSGKVNRDTKIICYVLGTFVEQLDEGISTDGETIVYPRTYNTILRQANARTFHLLKKIELAQDSIYKVDKEFSEVLDPDQTSLFSENTDAKLTS